MCGDGMGASECEGPSLPLFAIIVWSSYKRNTLVLEVVGVGGELQPAGLPVK
jgi:hypothetical protein